MSNRHGRSLLGTLFAMIGILVVLFLVVGYGRGWIEFTNEEDRVNIEIDKTGAKSDADNAIRETEEALQRAGEKLNDVTQDLSNSPTEAEESALSDDPAS